MPEVLAGPRTALAELTARASVVPITIEQYQRMIEEGIVTEDSTVELLRGVLVREPEPCLFAYFQDFSVPDTGERLSRRGFIGLSAVEDYSAGVVHRHDP